MKSLLLNLDSAAERFLEPLALIAGTCDAHGLAYFVIGATARDLLLEGGFGVRAGRATNDLDLAVRVADWESFAQLKSELEQTGEFDARRGAPHRLLYRGVFEIDIVPFGAIERADGSIAWPPRGEVVMSTVGFDDAYRHVLRAETPSGLQLKLASLPGLALLKLVAWSDRHLASDAYDLDLILRNYARAGNEARLFDEHDALLSAVDYDLTAAGVRLLGRDLRNTASPASRQLLADVLGRESDPDGNLELAIAMAGRPADYERLEAKRTMLAALLEEVCSTAEPG